VRVPTVSSDAGARREVQRACELAADLARDAGAADVRIVAAGGLPGVLASWPAPEGAPTVLLYAHLDVQPTGPLEEWTSRPSSRPSGTAGSTAAAPPTTRRRAHAPGRAAGLRRAAPGGRRPVPEGEEEVGSPTLPALLAEHAELLRADVIVIADSSNASVDVPAFTTSLRGFVDATVEVRVLESAVHSGVFGGAVPDALSALCRLLATLQDDAGDVAVDGLVARGPTPRPADDELRSAAGLLDGVELIGTGTLPERLWHRPAVAVLGMDAPATAQASNVLLPRARAVVSLRIAPDQDEHAAMAALSEHLRSHAPWGSRVEVLEGSAGAGFRLETTGAVYDLARAAFASAYGSAPVEMGSAGRSRSSPSSPAPSRVRRSW
jgi:acetylornithine deacetylase/succinyl-diaminopimelate desuccinylase-like protein